MELYYEKREGYSILTGYSGTEEHIDIVSHYENLPVIEIAPGVFKNHLELLTVKIPMSIQRIGDDCFRGCKNLTCICIADADEHSVFPPALYHVGDRAFEYSDLTKVTFTSPYLELGSYAFHESGVVDVWFRDAIKITLNEGVFSRCSNLEFVSYFETGLEDGLPMHAFAYCGKLRKILANYLIGGIGAGCFFDCFELEELPIRRPLNFVGEEAFSGCKKLKTNGYYRTMRDVLNGLGDVALMSEIVQQKTRHCSWGPKEHVAEYVKHIEDIGKETLREIHSVPRMQRTNIVLIKAVGSEYYSASNGWDFVERFYLFTKHDIIHRFKPIADFDITYEWDWPELRPPTRTFDNLTQEDVLRLLLYENGPKPQQYNWDKDMGLILDAELAGDAADYQVSLATDFLTRLIDHKLHPNWTENHYDITNDKLAEECSLEDPFCTQSEKLHQLKWDILFNRINLYRELRKAFIQFAADLFNKARR